MTEAIYSSNDVRSMLRDLATQHGSQTAMAGKLGISASFLCLVMQGKRKPNAPILDALGLSRVVGCYYVKAA